MNVSIARPPEVVYDFVMTPERLPEWAPGFAHGVHSEAGGWVVETSSGAVGIEFTRHNDLGVADHTVTLGGGAKVTNPIRVLPNGPGAEVIFTLFQRPEVTAQEFEVDAATVLSDLEALKRVLEADNNSSAG